MAQPPPASPGPGPEPGRDPGLPGGDTGLPGGAPRSPGAGARDPRLAAFAEDGAGDAGVPGPGLASAVDELSGPERRCAGATDDELVGLLGRWAALESWAAAGKLGVVRELIRRRALPGNRHGDLPDAWDGGVGHEVTAALGVSFPGADKLLQVAWELQARLPGIGAKLAGGVIDYTKAKIIVDELYVLTDDLAATAEALIVDDLAGKTPGQIAKLAAAAVCAVDPEGAAKRREHAEREDARVRFWREQAGTAALAGYGLPTDAALAASAAINQRAQQYKKAKVNPGATMDQLRVLAYLDLLNGISAEARIAQARAAQAEQAEAQAPAEAQARQAATDNDQSGQSAGRMPGGPPGGGTNGQDYPGDGPDGPGSDGDGPGGPGAGGPGEDGPGEDGPGAGGPGHDCPGGGSGDSPGGEQPAAPGPALPARVNLTIPFSTLLDLAERPGEGHGLGPLDPALARDLAATAARSPHSEWCVTVTNAAGMAIGHGCAKPARAKPAKPPPPGSRHSGWALTQRDDTGPPDGFGTWTITLPGGHNLTVSLGPVPLTDCDHRHESHGYEPSDTLRHLVQIRDGECTFPPCSRHARESDFEHAIPYDKGGKTCTCNAGARSRRCHKVKQSKGWSVTQPLPGWHLWTTPSGRTYAQGPKQYPA